jgi:nicotinate-nucleotide adenylyltransferase
MKVGLFFGSFNPIHIGHLIIASYMVDYTDLGQVWFVVSPQNPLKHKKHLLSEYERMEMVRLAIQDDSRFQATDIEFNMPRPSYTIDTLLHLEEKYPDKEFVLIMGSDSVASLPKWKNYEQLLQNYKTYAYPRPEYHLTPDQLHPNIKLVEGVPLMEISATFIRQTIKNKKSVKYLLPEKVFQFIDKWGYYL